MRHVGKPNVPPGPGQTATTDVDPDRSGRGRSDVRGVCPGNGEQINLARAAFGCAALRERIAGAAVFHFAFSMKDQNIDRNLLG